MYYLGCSLTSVTCLFPNGACSSIPFFIGISYLTSCFRFQLYCIPAIHFHYFPLESLCISRLAFLFPTNSNWIALLYSVSNHSTLINSLSIPIRINFLHFHSLPYSIRHILILPTITLNLFTKLINYFKKKLFCQHFKLMLSSFLAQYQLRE